MLTGTPLTLWASLISDAAVRERNKAAEAEPTPLCLLFGQGHQHFLERLSSVPRETTPPLRRVNGEEDRNHGGGVRMRSLVRPVDPAGRDALVPMGPARRRALRATRYRSD